MQISSGGHKGRKKGVNFELNLVPFIDVLSVCICFLLVTTVFMSLGSFHVSQAIGDEKQEKTDSSKDRSLMVSFGDRGIVKVALQQGQKTLRSLDFEGNRGRVDFDRLGKWLAQLSQGKEEYKTVLLLPNPVTKYDDLIQVMAQFKQNSFENIGVAPL
jgi:biopolymer transport protein ExbD